MINYLKTSIGQKQLVAISGLGMVFFLIAHLLGNFLIFLGPQAINDYSDKLHDLGPLLWVARIGLIVIFLMHFSLVVYLTMKNKKARPVEYVKPLHKKTRSIFTATMRISGVLIFVYIFWHLYDYTLTPHSMDNSVINGEYYGLYGHVYNSFLNPIRSVFYILVMFSIGFHLIHGVYSVLQTFGFSHKVYSPVIKKTTVTLAILLSLGFSSIPVYVLIHNNLNWSL
ncbi:succinate:quinone oxidoreductase [Candidatus Marinamargulisbacteria bacterium SCGC AG-343-D04]|nr:succinate:quinone oxidoreductase [Candidatus Marinamargulisbacteria bacterium SCGC AG-343-D04]